MTLVSEHTDAKLSWPAEVEMMISAIEAGQRTPRDRRKRYRLAHRTVASLRLFVDGDGRTRTIYTRNADSRGVGFLSQERLPLGYGGTVELRSPSGDTISANCTIFRCCEMVNGWYEAALSFNTEQWQFDARACEPTTGSTGRPP